mmetsp:Transcript_13707/g.28126  ORF Transcript_13707/g.28126 Transcript_13707/m.28126 type:complete len:89 (+) Transcript_13707:370-636(+)
MSRLSFFMDRPRRPAHLTTMTLFPGLIMVALALTLTWTGWINDIGDDEQVEFLHGKATQTRSLDNDDIVSRMDNGGVGFDAHMDRMDQ